MLKEQDRQKLDGIVGEMTANKESDADIQFVVNDFKSKYDSPTPIKLDTPEVEEKKTSLFGKAKTGAFGDRGFVKTELDTLAGTLFKGVGSTAGAVEEATGKALGFSSRVGGFVGEGFYKGLGKVVGVFSDNGGKALSDLGDQFQAEMEAQRTQFREVGKDVNRFLTQGAEDAKNTIMSKTNIAEHQNKPFTEVDKKFSGEKTTLEKEASRIATVASELQALPSVFNTQAEVDKANAKIAQFNKDLETHNTNIEGFETRYSEAIKNVEPDAFHISDLADPQFLMYDLQGALVENAPMMILSIYTGGKIAPAVGASGNIAKFFANVAGTTGFSTTLNALRESEGKYSEILNAGGTKEQAFLESERIFTRNLAGNTGLEAVQMALRIVPGLKVASPFLKTLIGATKLGGAGITEALQERFEDEVQAQSEAINFDYNDLFLKITDPTISKTDVISATMGILVQGIGGAFVDNNVKARLDKVNQAIKTSEAFDIEGAIKADPTMEAKIYSDTKNKILTEDFAKGRIEDVVQKAEAYQQGLGDKVRNAIDAKNTTYENIIETGLKVVKDAKVSPDIRQSAPNTIVNQEVAEKELERQAKLVLEKLGKDASGDSMKALEAEIKVNPDGVAQAYKEVVSELQTGAETVKQNKVNEVQLITENSRAKNLLESGSSQNETILALSETLGIDTAAEIVNRIAPEVEAKVAKEEAKKSAKDIAKQAQDDIKKTADDFEADQKTDVEKSVEELTKEVEALKDEVKNAKPKTQEKSTLKKALEEKRKVLREKRAVEKEQETTKPTQSYSDAVDKYKQNTLGEKGTGNLDALIAEAQKEENRAYLESQIASIKKNKDGSITTYRVGSSRSGNIAVTLSEGTANVLSAERKKQGKSSEITKITVQPEQIKAVVAGIENELIIDNTQETKKATEITTPIEDQAQKARELAEKQIKEAKKSPTKKEDKTIDKDITKTNNKDNEKDNDTGDSDNGGGTAEVVQVGKPKPDGTGGDAKKPSRKGDKSKLPDNSDKSGERPATRLTNEQVAEKVEAITEVSNTGEVLLTGKVTEELREQANQYTTGGKSKEGRGILDEYYTNSKIVDAVKSLLNFEGTQSLKVLEPSVGVGNFLYALPETAKHNINAFEINDTTARIAKIFHQDANINTNSFETLFIDERGNKKEFKSDYDLILGNPPYGDHRGKYKGLGEEKGINKYEEYFIKRGLDLLNKNGTLALIVPSSFLRSGSSETKIGISAMGKLVNAYRFPNGVFEGTDIGTDLVIFKKRDWDKDMTDLVSLTDDSFFKENPDNVLGTTKKKKNRFGKMEDVVSGTLDEALSLLDANRNKHDAIEVAGKNATSEEVESVQKDLDEGVTKEQAKKTAEAQKTGKKTIKKRIVKSAHKKHTEVISLNEHFKGDYTDAEMALWKVTSPDGSVGATEVKGNEDLLNYEDGKWYLDFNYAQGDIYRKLHLLEHAKATKAIDKARYESQKKKLEAVRPTQEAIDDIILAPNSKFVADLEIGTAEGETGKEITLRSAFLSWTQDLPRGSFGDSSQWEVRGYVNNEQVRGSDKNLNELTRQRRKRVADDLIRKFLKDGLTPEQQDTVADKYNETFNFYYTPDYSKVPMFADTYKYLEKITKGKVEFDMRPVQKEGVGRLVNKGVGILAHDVGFGKTISGVLANSEYMARGWAKRPLIIAPNENVYAQWVNTIQDVVPNAKLNLLGNLGATYKGDLSSLKIPEGSFTLVTYEGLKKLSFKDETYSGMSGKFKYLSDDLDKAQTKRSIEKGKAEAERVGGTMKKGTREDLYFEDLGFDLLTFDEIHNANHIVSKVKLEKGQASEFNRFSLRPSDLGMKTWLASQYIQEQNNGRNVIGLSATPFTNHPLEYYSILSLVADDSLSKMGFHNVNEFFNTFMEAEHEYEFKADGSYQMKTDVRSFKNYRQFSKLLDTYIDFKEGDAKGIKRPNRVQREYHIPANALTLEMEAKAQLIFKEDETKDGKSAKVLRAINELRKIAFSPYASQFAEAPANYKEFVENSPKIKTLMGLLKQNKKDQKDAGQIVYFDQVGISFMPLVKEYLLKELKYKASEVEIISGGISKPKRLIIQNKYNSGEVKIILGSQAIQEGMNLQENTTDMNLLALPWNFTSLRQVIGRGWRQGNQWANIRINNFYMEDSIDVFMSQKLDNKAQRYVASIKRGDQEVDIGDVDHNALKFDLIKDPETRAKLELEAEKEQVKQEEIQAQADLAFATRKIEKLEELEVSIKYNESLLVEEQAKYEQRLKENPDDASDWWVERYKKDLKRDKKARDEELARLKERGEDVKTLTERQTKMQAEVDKLKAKSKDLSENFDERVATIKAEMPERTSFSDATVQKFVDERAEHNKTFYTKAEAETTDTVSVETVEKPIKSKSGKVVKTKKTVKAVAKKKEPAKKKTTVETAMLNILTDKNLTTEAKVDKLLGKKQAGKKFKDAGERVAGSKKENATIQTVIEHGDSDILKQLTDELGADAVLAQLSKHKILAEEAVPNRETEIMEETPAWIANYKVNVFKKINIKPVTVETRGKYRSTRLVPERIMDAFIAKYPEMLKAFVADLVDIKTLEDTQAFEDKYRNNLGFVRGEKLSKEGLKSELELAEGHTNEQDKAERISTAKDEAKHGLKTHINIAVLGKSFHNVLDPKNVKESGAFTTGIGSYPAIISIEEAGQIKEALENDFIYKDKEQYRYKKPSDYSASFYESSLYDTKEEAKTALADYLGEKRMKMSEYKAKLEEKSTFDTALETDYDKFLPEVTGGVTKQLLDAEKELAHIQKSIKMYEDKGELKDYEEDYLKKYREREVKQKSFIARLKGEEKTIKHGNFESIDEYDVKDSRFKKSQVTTDNLMKVYGFKSAQLGNYMDDASSHEHIVQTMGAMEDMSKILGVDFASVANKMGLSIAFGARGGGTALAHYEPTHNIINLTKKRGDGSFGHEFMHALDYTLGKDTARGKWSGKGSRYRYGTPTDQISLQITRALTNGVRISKPPTEFKPSEDVDESYAFTSVKRLRDAGKTFDEALKETKSFHYQQLANVYRKTFTADVMENSNEYYKNSKAYGGGKDTSYWVKSHELWARAFQAYLQDKMANAGIKNNYLTRNTKDIKVYPQGQERIEYNKMFDELFKAVAGQYPLDAKKEQVVEGVTPEEYKQMTATEEDMDTLAKFAPDYEGLGTLDEKIERDSVGASFGIRKQFKENNDWHKALVLNTLYNNYETVNKDYGLFKNALALLKKAEPKVYKDIESDGSGYTGGALATVLHTYVYEGNDLVKKQKEHEATPSGEDVGKPRFKERTKTAIPLTDGGKYLQDVKDRLKLDFDVQFVDNILIDQAGGEAVGVYYKGAIGIVNEFKDTTAPHHETVHLTLANMSKIDAFKGMTADEIMLAKAEQMGITYSRKKTHTLIEETLAEEFEQYVANKYKPKGKVKEFFEKLIELWKQLVRLAKGDRTGIIQNYYDILLTGRSVDNEMVRIENEGMIETFVIDGKLDVLEMVKVNAEKRGLFVPKFKLKEENHFQNIKSKYNKVVTQQDKVENTLRENQTKLAEALNIRETKEDVVKELLGDKVKDFRKYLTKEKVLSATGEKIAQGLGYSPQKVNETLSKYLKSKTEFEEIKADTIDLKHNIASLRKESKTIVVDKKEAQRRLLFAKVKLVELSKSIKTAERFGRDFADTVEKARKRQMRELVAISKIAGQSVSDLVQNALGTDVDWRSMDDKQFEGFVTGLTNMSQVSVDKEIIRGEIGAIEEQKNLKYVNSLIKQLFDKTSISSLSKKELHRLKQTLEVAQQNDMFLPPTFIKKIQTLKNDDYFNVDINTYRELKDNYDIDPEDIKNVSGQYIVGGSALAKLSPFHKLLVEMKLVGIGRARKVHEKRVGDVAKLVHKARKSRRKKEGIKYSVKSFFVARDEYLAKYIQASPKEQDAIKKEMTREEIEAGDKLIDVYLYHEKYISDLGVKSRFVGQYMPMQEKGFWENLIWDGDFKSAVKSIFADAELEKKMATIFENTDGVLAYHKFFRHMLKREGKLDPSLDVLQTFTNYDLDLEKKRQIDKYVPFIMGLAKIGDMSKPKNEAGFPTGQVKPFVTDFLNDAKGRRYSFLKNPTQGGKFDKVQQKLIYLITLRFLWGSISYNIVNIGGAIVGSSAQFTRVKDYKNLARNFIKIFGNKRLWDNVIGVGDTPIQQWQKGSRDFFSTLSAVGHIGVGYARVFGDRLYFAGKLTREQLENAELEATKPFAKLLVDYNDTMMVDGATSIYGNTVEMKSFRQFKSWGLPALTSTIQDTLSVASKAMDGLRNKQLPDYKKEDFARLHKIFLAFVIGKVLIEAVSLLLPDCDEDKDKGVYCVIKRKLKRDLNLIAEVMGMFWFVDERSGTITADLGKINIGMAYYIELLGNLKLMVIDKDVYKVDGKGYAIGDSKGAKALQRHIIPTALTQFGIGYDYEKRDTELKLIKEAIETGNFSAEAIQETLNPKDWNNLQTKTRSEQEQEEYRKKKVGEMTKLYNIHKKYGFNNELVNHLLNGDGSGTTYNEEKATLMVQYAKQNGVQETRKELLEMRRDRNLCTNPSSHTGCLVSERLWKDYLILVRKSI